MSWFSKKPTAAEAAKTAKKEVRSSQRDIDKEIRELDRREKQVMADIKKRAKVAPNNSDSVLRTLASQMVQIRSQREKMIKARAHVGGMGMKGEGFGEGWSEAAPAHCPPL